jgi:O-antigen ligase
MGERSTDLLPRIGWGALVAAAALVPIAYTRALADPFSLPKATLWWIAAILAVVGVASEVVSVRSWPVPRLRIALPLAVLVAWTLLATLLSPQPIVSALGQYGRYDGLASLVSGVVVVLAMVAFIGREPQRLASIAWAVVAGAAVSLVVVVVQGLGWAWNGWQTAEQGANAIVGLAGNSNFSGAVLALAVPFALGLRAHDQRPWVGHALLAGAVALAGGVLWSATRGGLLALLAGVAAFGALSPRLLPKAVWIVAAVGLAAGLGAVGVASLSDASGSASVGTEAVMAQSSLRQRQNIWAGAAKMVQESPVVGVGPDAFALRFPEVRSSRVGGRGLIQADEAHDIYLDRAATSGLPAVAAYLWTVGTVVVVAWRRRRSVPPGQQWILGAFGGALAGYLVQGIFSIDMVPLAFLAWTAVGGVVVVTDPAVAAERDGAARPRTPVPGWAVAGLAVGALLAIGLALRPVLADRQARAGQLAEADEPLEAYGRFASASSWLGHEPRYHQRQATSLVAAAAAEGTDPQLRQTLLDEALIAYDHALDQAPGDVLLRQAQAETHVLAAEAASDTDVSIDHLDRAIRTYRDLVRSVQAPEDLRIGYGRALEARAGLRSGAAAAQDRELAARQYEAARSYLATRADGALGLARLAVDEGRLVEARTLLVDARREAAGDDRFDAAIEELDRRIQAGS